ncbi:MAG: hypothetical protein ABGZ17_26435 [Planctomycetaceae bacterium]
MPIKFRCQKCRQYLGISRSKAGQIVDCPTCGRSVRVPGLDGQVVPLPTPAMDMQDASLVNALDALARIGDETEQPVDDPAGEADKPTVVDEPIVIEPAVAAVPIMPPLADDPDVIDPSSDTIELYAAPSVTGDKTLLLDNTPASGDTQFNSTLIQLAQMATPPVLEVDDRRPSARWWPLPWIMVAIVMFAAGYVLRGLGPQRSVDVALPSDAQDAEGPSIQPVEQDTALRGRITYLDPDGQRHPDRGARILVFAQDHPGVVTVSAIGLRSPVDGPDYGLTRAAWKSLGGDLAVADPQGEFQVLLPGPGEYPVLVISHFARRSPDLETPDDLANLLGQYVDRPNQLLGQLQFHFESVRYQGSGTLTWDHTFR